MPYLVAKEGKSYNVYKKGDDGKPEGKPLGTHPDENSANKQLAALYSSEEDDEQAKGQESTRKVRTGYFGELVDLSESAASLDAANMTMRVTLIKPGWSANGRYYSKPMLKEAVAKFDGTKAYADHPAKSEAKERPERSVRDVVGFYKDPKQEEDGRLTAALRFTDEPLFKLAEVAIKENPSLIGLSINALGRTVLGEAEGKKGVIVEAIEKANSTDIVTTPAAGGKFDTLLASSGDEFTTDLFKAMSIDELKETLREVRPDLLEALKVEWKTPRDSEALNSARAELESLKETVNKLETESRAAHEAQEKAEADKATAERRVLADGLLKEAKLPEKWLETIREEVYSCADEAGMKAVIAREEDKAALLPAAKLAPKGAGAAVSAPVTESKRQPVVISSILGGHYNEAQRNARNVREFREATLKRQHEEALLRENH
jgi:hypothetical protein